MASIRSRIRIENDGDDGFFNIGYRASDPVQAYNIVQALLDQFITANVSRSTTEIAQAATFLDKQIADYSAKLRASNQEIADFRRRHPEVASVGTPGMTSDAASEVASARAAYEAALAGGGAVRAANPMAGSDRRGPPEACFSETAIYRPLSRRGRRPARAGCVDRRQCLGCRPRRP